MARIYTNDAKGKSARTGVVTEDGAGEIETQVEDRITEIPGIEDFGVTVSVGLAVVSLGVWTLSLFSAFHVQVDSYMFIRYADNLLASGRMAWVASAIGIERRANASSGTCGRRWRG